MLEIIAYTDGSCLGNPGVGGYAARMEAKGKKQYCQGYEIHDTTNNRMELSAVLNVLKWLNRVQKEPCKIIFHTDSQYIIDCMKHPFDDLVSKSRPNNDLFVQIIQETIKGGHTSSYVKVKGHNGNERNEEVDKLANAQAKKARMIRYGH